jgi:hypothetical protein
MRLLCLAKSVDGVRDCFRNKAPWRFHVKRFDRCKLHSRYWLFLSQMQNTSNSFAAVLATTGNGVQQQWFRSTEVTFKAATVDECRCRILARHIRILYRFWSTTISVHTLYILYLLHTSIYQTSPDRTLTSPCNIWLVWSEASAKVAV